MRPGDRVVCRMNDRYQLTIGKVYVVQKYEPRRYDLGFTWPAYVYLRDDRGVLVCCRAHKFTPCTEELL